MNDQSKMFDPMTSEDSHSATSSPVSADGPKPFVSQAGPMIVLSGRVHVPANLSARQAKERGLLMSGTFGRHGSTSSASSSLQQSLVNKLMQRLNMAGSTLFNLTWKPLVTPSGIQSSLLRASGLRMDDIGCGSWPSPKASNTTGAMQRGEGGLNLQTAVQLAAWVSPTAMDANRGVKPPRPHDKGIPLSQQVAPRSTPRANKRGFPDSHGSDERPLDSGLMPIGYHAAMTSGGPLNPEFSRWLMGYPAEWTYSEGLEMPSSRKSRQRSLKQQLPDTDGGDR